MSAFVANPLIEAAKKGDLEKVKPLLDNGAQVNHQDQYGMTALLWASINGHADVVGRLLAQEGVDVNQGDDDGATA